MMVDIITHLLMFGVGAAFGSAITLYLLFRGIGE
jgi:hypothetical protein